MNIKRLVCAICLVVMACFAWLAIAQENKTPLDELSRLSLKPEESRASERAVWEYKVVSLKIDSKVEGRLNELGLQGWELVSYDDYNAAGGQSVDAGTFFFKRAKIIRSS